MKRRHALPPDTRPDWRDPEMPVMRDYVMPNLTKKTIVDPDYEHRYRQHMMESGSGLSFRSDPTYNLRRKPK